MAYNILTNTNDGMEEAYTPPTKEPSTKWQMSYDVWMKTNYLWLQEQIKYTNILKYHRLSWRTQTLCLASLFA